jgi:hypothetical protein
VYGVRELDRLRVHGAMSGSVKTRQIASKKMLSAFARYSPDGLMCSSSAATSRRRMVSGQRPPLVGCEQAHRKGKVGVMIHNTTWSGPKGSKHTAALKERYSCGDDAQSILEDQMVEECKRGRWRVKCERVGVDRIAVVS